MTISVPVLALFLALVLIVGAVIGFLLGKSHAHSTLLDGARETAALREHAASAEARATRLLEENEGLIERSRSDANIMRALTPIKK